MKKRYRLFWNSDELKKKRVLGFISFFRLKNKEEIKKSFLKTKFYFGLKGQ